ncbi:MAG: SUMF1/EgtB/PvdO family nonheme iron enzyme [Solirubrobacterales bacterium]
MVAGQTTSTDLLATLEQTRERTLALVSALDEDDLARVVTPLLSPLVWDLGHIGNFEQRWLLGVNNDGLDEVYDPFKQPRALRGELPFLDTRACFEYMETVRAAVAERFESLDPYLVELVIGHEQQHNETMLQLLHLMDGYTPPIQPRREAVDGEEPLGAQAAAAASPSAWVEYPAGIYRVGSAPAYDGHFVYDNEIDAHTVGSAGFSIARYPVLCGDYAEWIDAGGYERAEWWSDEGRRWLATGDERMPLGWLRDAAPGEWFLAGFGEPRAMRMDEPVVHINWFEADAFARAHGARLPSEAEWEIAAAGDPAAAAGHSRRRYAWGDQPWTEGLANLDQLAFGCLPAGVCRPPGDGPLDMAGQVWEWTSTQFCAYPGFEPFCYADYSRPFFDAGYRVLRGGSWATRARTVDNRFRNWDLPQRRQIFSGARLARDT